VVWDESSYSSPAFLSGTPPLRNVQDVCHTADILGVHPAEPCLPAFPFPMGLLTGAYRPSKAPVSDAEKLSLLMPELFPVSYDDIHRRTVDF